MEAKRKSYELKNHLGNVIAVIGDHKLSNANNNRYNPEMLENGNYFPFGFVMPGRGTRGDLSGAVGDYRYGFNGMEKDGDVNGSSDVYDFGARLYDSRTGTWFSVDPKGHLLPHISPYNYGLSNPITFIDPDGQYPFTFHIRAFAPFSSFGGGFSGDNRGFSLAPIHPQSSPAHLPWSQCEGCVTARLAQSFRLETDNGITPKALDIS